MQPSTHKSEEKYKDPFDFESIVKSLKILTNEVSDLKRKKNDSILGSKAQKPFFRKNNLTTSRPFSNPNTSLNVEEIDKDNFFSFHQASHTEKTCPQWINSMTAMVNQLLEY